MEPNIHSGGKKGLPVTGDSGTYKGPEAVERIVPHGAKDTRRWCKGRVDIEHQPVWQFLFDMNWRPHPSEYQVKKCLECGRHCGLRVIRSDIPPSRQ